MCKLGSQDCKQIFLNLNIVYIYISKIINNVKMIKTSDLPTRHSMLVKFNNDSDTIRMTTRCTYT